MKIPLLDNPKFKRWLVIQKITLSRGAQWINTPLLSVIFVGMVKIIAPGWADTRWKVIGWVLLGLAGMYIVGWIDRRCHYFRTENNYGTEHNSIVMGMAEKVMRETDEKKNQDADIPK